MTDFQLPSRFQTAGSRVLDIGGWANPLKEATHVVDLFPWETRYYQLHLEPLPGERFIRDTWHQADFLDENLRLPFADGFFDFCICSHTLEDLRNPRPIVAEMRRVCRAGYIEVPSRLHEQTIGVRDRKGSRLGHPHHHWIVDVSDGGLLFCSKADSLSGAGGEAAVRLPLTVYERLVRSGDPALSPVTSLAWEGDLECQFITGGPARTRAVEFCDSMEVAGVDVWRDRAIRWARRVRDRLTGRRELMSDWREIVERSKPYSRIPLDNV